MASSLVEFRKQANPAVLGPTVLEQVVLEERVLEEAVLEEKRRTQFHPAHRVQQSFLARLEKAALLWLAQRTPAAINSDHLTALGFAAQVLAGASYALARWNRYWLLAGIAFLALNWLGDSLDGTLARVRARQRPRYGFYVDHIVDSFGALALMGGLALSGCMHPSIAIGVLVAFLLLSIQSYLATYTLGEFRISFWSFGPTELRLLLAIGNLALFRWPVVLRAHYRLFDIGGVVGMIGMAGMIVYFTALNIRRLYREEPLP
jgi:archaetidylinositol phosphate synthase